MHYNAYPLDWIQIFAKPSAVFGVLPANLASFSSQNAPSLVHLDCPRLFLVPRVPAQIVSLLRETWLLSNPSRPPLSLLPTPLCIHLEGLCIISRTYFLFYLFGVCYLLNLKLHGLRIWAMLSARASSAHFEMLTSPRCCYSWRSCTEVGCLLQGWDAVSLSLASLLCSLSDQMSLW